MSWGFPGLLKSRSGMDVVPTDGDLSGLCFGATSLLVPGIFKFKALIT